MKKTILLVLCVIFLFVSITSCSQSSKQNNDKVSLFSISQNGKWGFIDEKGKIVINPQFDDVSSFSEGLSGVKIGDKWGFIDKKGKIVINPQFDKVRGFSEGLCGVKIVSKYGFIDKTGKYVINPLFDRVGDFSEGGLHPPNWTKYVRVVGRIQLPFWREKGTCHETPQSICC
jgi:hypothetical protein